MDQKQVINIVRKYKEAVAAKYADAKVYLYGSYSKGTAHPDSDIDVAIIVPSIEGNWFAIVPPLWHMARAVNTLIEPVLMSEGEHSPLYEDVMKTGIIV